MTIIDDTPIVKPEIPPEKEIVKPTIWEDGEFRPNRLAGRPNKDTNRPIPNRSQLAIYQKIVMHEHEIIQSILEKSRSKNERISLEALKILIDKILPNKKAVELENKHAPITVQLISAGFIPPNPDVTPSMGGTERPAQIQGAGLASEGEEDDYSDNGNNETGDNEEGRLLAPVSNLRGS